MPDFKKQARLTSPREFAAVRERGLKVRRGAIAVAVLPGAGPRLGIAVSRRVGCAVQRNRIKRVVREHFRLERERYPRGDCVVIPGQGAALMSNDEIRAALGEAVDAVRRRLGSGEDRCSGARLSR